MPACPRFASSPQPWVWSPRNSPDNTCRVSSWITERETEPKEGSALNDEPAARLTLQELLKTGSSVKWKVNEAKGLALRPSLDFRHYAVASTASGQEVRPF
jgi:hypothetical protein